MKTPNVTEKDTTIIDKLLDGSCLLVLSKDNINIIYRSKNNKKTISIKKKQGERLLILLKLMAIKGNINIPFKHRRKIK